MTNHLPMNTNYTDDQIQTAIDAAFPQAGPSFLANLDTSPDAPHWPAEADNRLAIARAFLAALPKPEADPYARLKAYNEAGAMLRAFDIAAGKWGIWVNKFPWRWDVSPENYEVHPDDLHLCPEYAPPRASRPLPAQVNAEPTESWANADNAKAFQGFQAEIEAVWEDKPTDGPLWIPHDGGPCPLKDEEVEEWEFKFRDGDIRRVPGNPNAWRWRHRKEAGDIIAYRVQKWKPGFGSEAKAQPCVCGSPTDVGTVHRSDGPCYQAEDQPTTSPSWTPAVGDTVRLKSGGPEMTVFYVNEGVFFCQHKDVQKRNDLLGWIPGHVPDEIRPNEPTQEEQWRSEFEACFPDFDLTKQDTGGYLHAHAATAWRAFLAAKKGGAK